MGGGGHSTILFVLVGMCHVDFREIGYPEPGTQMMFIWKSCVYFRAKKEVGNRVLHLQWVGDIITGCWDDTRFGILFFGWGKGI